VCVGSTDTADYVAAIKLVALRDFAVSHFMNNVVFCRQIAVEVQVPTDEFLVFLLHDGSPSVKLPPVFVAD